VAKAKFPNSTEAVNAILNESIPMYASNGFSGVSMRHVAKAVGISIATLYHHFPDKKTLYLKTIERAFSDKAEGISDAINIPGTKEERLQSFILRFTQLMSSDPNFRILLQRELLDADNSRLQILADQVFKEQFQNVLQLAKEIAPMCDPHLMAISIVGLILFHLETTPIRMFLPEGRSEHNEPKVIAHHVYKLLKNGILRCDD
jgi:TetR/AcrR family transcriptional regulator